MRSFATRKAFQKTQDVKIDILYNTLAQKMKNISMNLRKEARANPNLILENGPIALEEKDVDERFEVRCGKNNLPMKS